jgi:hypothetical protein
VPAPSKAASEKTGEISRFKTELLWGSVLTFFGPFDSDDDCRVGVVGENVASDAGKLPAEALGAVEAIGEVLPGRIRGVREICVECHEGQVQDCLSICYVGT